MCVRRSGETRHTTSTLTLEYIGLWQGKLLEDSPVQPVELQFLKTGDAQLFLVRCVIRSFAIIA